MPEAKFQIKHSVIEHSCLLAYPYLFVSKLYISESLL